MTPLQIDVVKASWAQLASQRFAVGERFYQRLFKLDPSLRPLFKDDMTEQQRRLAVMLDIAVCGLDEMSLLLPIVYELGARHARYGVDAEHYGTVGAALLWAIGDRLGADFTAEAESAWTAFYDLVANTMQAGQSGLPAHA